MRHETHRTGSGRGPGGRPSPGSPAPGARRRLRRRGIAALPGPLRRLAGAAYTRAPFPWNRGLTFAMAYRGFVRNESLSADELVALQQRELQRIVRYAYSTVPAYRERFREAGASWQDIVTQADLARLPVLDKADLQDAPTSFVSNEFPADRITWRTTSGSTGTPLRVGLTSAALTAEHALMVRGWQWSGYRTGEPVAVCVGELTGRTQGPPFAPFVRTRKCLELSPHHLDERGCDAYIDMLREFRPRYVRTYPSIANLLGNRMRERKLQIPGVMGLWTQSENLDAADRERIEEAWGARIYDLYGMQEKCVFMIECEHGRLHLRSDFGVVELVPTGRGGMSEVVATGFHNLAMPLIRYRTHDLAEPDGTPCPCGRAFPTIKRIVGRIEDCLYASNGREIFEIDSAIADMPRIRSCQIVQERLDRVRVRVVPAPNFDDSDAAVLRRRMQELLGHDTRIEVECRATLPRTATGKQRFIVSRLEPRETP